ncbi:MAG TPA: transposase [Dehalococcoidia bacterium]|nr:transposase [Dehalococcoidia bacterium]
MPPVRLNLAAGPTAAPAVAQALDNHLEAFLRPLLGRLDAVADTRLVRTFLATIRAILTFRHGRCGLRLSELGGYLLSPAQAAAGTKRISNLLRSDTWTSRLIVWFLWTLGEARVCALEATGEPVWVLWDESVLEKPESRVLPGLCAVRSRKAERLKRRRPGFVRPPTFRPIFVPGMNWLALLVIGLSGPPRLAAMRWWSTHGPRAEDKRAVEADWLLRCTETWARRVIHVFDRGFAGAPWLSELATAEARFVMRWPTRYKLFEAQGNERKPGEISRRSRSWGYRRRPEGRRRVERKIGLVAIPVHHPAVPPPLWLVVARPGPKHKPWYLLTSEPVPDLEAAWRIVLIYARRWQIELAWRYGKSELSMESPRLWSWEHRRKLLLMASLAYAFLLTLLDPDFHAIRHWLLNQWCHRTGRRSHDAATPLYRIRSALSRLWLWCQTPALPPPLQTPG